MFPPSYLSFTFDTQEQDVPWVPADTTNIKDLEENEGGDVTDGTAKPTPCTQRWKASTSESTKRALAVYDTTGIFASACRHSFILKITEMVRSGEL